MAPDQPHAKTIARLGVTSWFPPSGVISRIDTFLNMLYPLDRDRVIEKILNTPPE